MLLWDPPSFLWNLIDEESLQVLSQDVHCRLALWEFQFTCPVVFYLQLVVHFLCHWELLIKRAFDWCRSFRNALSSRLVTLKVNGFGAFPSLKSVSHWFLCTHCSSLCISLCLWASNDVGTWVRCQLGNCCVNFSFATTVAVFAAFWVSRKLKSFQKALLVNRKLSSVVGVVTRRHVQVRRVSRKHTLSQSFCVLLIQSI